MTVIGGRATSILERFPAHLEAVDETKLFARVVDAFAREIDQRSSEVGRIRRAHRLGDAPTEWDVRAHAALHGLMSSDFDLLTRRLDPLRAAAATLLAEPGSPAATDARATLPALIGLPADAFAPWESESDTTAADQRLGNALRDAARYAEEVAHLRGRVAAFAALHQAGNATPTVLLRAAATHLGLGVRSIGHSDDRYWHLARCTDLLTLAEPQPPSDTPGVPSPAALPVTPLPDILALEDNPFRTAVVDPVERPHGARFLVTRSGWEEVPVTVLVQGIGERTMVPMVVNIDSGVGVAFTGSVPDGSELRFEAVGIATLDEVPVTRECFGFQGGVFAEQLAGHDNDFVFADADDPSAVDDRTATWVEAVPYADAFERIASFPHAAGTLTAPELRVGDTRWAFLVGVGHFGTRALPDEAPPIDLLAAPRPFGGRFDRSVFHPWIDATSGSLPSGAVGFTWQEREAFAARLWLPRRLAELDAEQPVPVTERIRLLLDRFRAAGVHLYVRYADERWVLGTGLLRDLDSDDGLGVVIAGTALWNDEVEQPPPDT